MVNELKIEIAKKNEEIEMLKRTSANVKLIEVQIANEILMQENARLASKLKFRSLKPGNEEGKESRPAEHELIARISFLEEKCLETEVESINKTRLEICQKERNKLQELLRFQKSNLVQERRRSLLIQGKLKQTEETLNQSLVNKPDFFRDFLQIPPQEHIHNIISQKNQIVDLLNRKIQSLQEKLQANNFEEEQKIFNLEKKLQEKEKELSKMEEKFKFLVCGNDSENSTKHKMSKTFIFSRIASNGKVGQRQSSEGNEVMKPTVRFEEVKSIGFEIMLQMIAKNVSHEDLIGYLLPDKFLQDGFISFGSMQEILKDFPFEIQSDEKLVLFARYLIEENRLPLTTVSNKNVCNVKIVKSIFKKLVPFYKLEDFQNVSSLESNLRAFLKPHKTFLMFVFRDLSHNDGKTDYENLMKILKGKPVEMTPVNVLRTIFSLYLKSKSLSALPWFQLLN